MEVASSARAEQSARHALIMKIATEVVLNARAFNRAEPSPSSDQRQGREGPEVRPGVATRIILLIAIISSASALTSDICMATVGITTPISEMGQQGLTSCDGASTQTVLLGGLVKEDELCRGPVTAAVSFLSTMCW